MPQSGSNILFNFKLKNEASRANIKKHKRILNGGHFGKKVYIFVYPQILRTEFQFGCKVLLFKFLLIFLLHVTALCH